MRFIRRIVQVVGLIGTLVIGMVAFVLIASQTPWFKDWLPGYIARQSQQYRNGELSSGRLAGNLFYGVELADVVIRLNGENVIAVKDVGVDYSVFNFVSSGIIIDDIRL